MFEKLKALKEYATSEEVAPISRRYFTMNGFDGAMTFLGILLGAITAGLDQSSLMIVIYSAVSASVSIGLSGVSGAFMAERAERVKELERLEQKMLKDMQDTEIGAISELAPLWVAIVDGSSPIITSMAPLPPLFIAYYFPDVLAPQMSGYFSVGISIVIIFLLGAYLGKISKRSMLFNGLKMVAAGAFMTTIILFIGKA